MSNDYKTRRPAAANRAAAAPEFPWPNGCRSALMPAFDVVGVKPAGYRAPYGENTDDGLAMLQERGIVYSSSWRDDIRPYRHVLSDGRPGPIEIPVNFSFDDWGYGLTHRHAPRTLMPREH